MALAAAGTDAAGLPSWCRTTSRARRWATLIRGVMTLPAAAVEARSMMAASGDDGSARLVVAVHARGEASSGHGVSHQPSLALARLDEHGAAGGEPAWRLRRCPPEHR